MIFLSFIGVNINTSDIPQLHWCEYRQLIFLSSIELISNQATSKTHLTSLCSIGTDSFSLMGRRSGPRPMVMVSTSKVRRFCIDKKVTLTETGWTWCPHQKSSASASTKNGTLTETGRLWCPHQKSGDSASTKNVTLTETGWSWCPHQKSGASASTRK